MERDGSTVRNPGSPEEWQAAVNAAHGALTLDACREYGLVRGGPVVNVQRCLCLLEEGRKMGVIPSPRAVEEFVASVQAQAGRKGK